MKVLVVYAHPNPKSFNHAILESFTTGLKEGGHIYEIVDLFESKFDPSFKLEDFAQFTGKPMLKDVVEQQEKVAWAEALAFIYPIYWWSQPAIMKGWLDRVLSVGFAYRFGKQGPERLLKHTKVLIISTAAGREESYEKSGQKDAIKCHDRAVFDLCGIQNVEHVFFYAVGWDPEARVKYLEIAKKLGKEL